MTKKIIVAGNWKMNKTYLEAKSFIAKLNGLPDLKTKTIIGVPAVYADRLVENNQKENVHIALQNVSPFEEGAYTGEISAKMIASLDMDYCIIGHSERKQYFRETDEVINLKLHQLLIQNIHPILCIGETQEERDADETFNVIRRQIFKGFKEVSTSDMKSIILAYEPVWAIGTGLTATETEAQEVHKFIHDLISELYNSHIAAKTPILYGGSCNEKNAEGLFSQPNIWGGLIGGASLKVESIYKIMEIAERIND